MMRTLFALLLVSASLSVFSQSLIGAWKSVTPDSNGRKVVFSVTFTESHQSAALYYEDTGEFISTNGGLYSISGNQITETVEFDSNNPDRVGSSITFDFKVEEDTLFAEGSAYKWARVDDGDPGKLAGAWLMSGRKRDGEIQSRDTNQPRKTMKILSGTRFQWIAYNTETKEFMGTGGGTYTTIDGMYTENIEFFSRDGSRVGASLPFNFELINGNWHHSGKSSKGDPIYEIWSQRKD